MTRTKLTRDEREEVIIRIGLNRSPWTKAMTEVMCALWNEGKSASEIAETLPGQLSRNAIIGKILRLKEGGRKLRSTSEAARSVNDSGQSRLKRAAIMRPHLTDKDFKNPTPITKAVKSAVQSPNAKTWTERRDGQCAYLIDKSTACCNPVGDGSKMAATYCSGHFEAMIDRPGMVRAQAKRGVFNKGVPARLVTVWDAGRGV